MHREECDIEADEEEPKTELAKLLIEHASGDLRKPVGHCPEEREDRAANEEIVEMRDDEVGVVHLEIDRDGRHENAGHAAHSEGEEEAEDPPHRRLEDYLASSHGGDPAENLGSTGNG